MFKPIFTYISGLILGFEVLSIDLISALFGLLIGVIISTYGRYTELTAITYALDYTSLDLELDHYILSYLFILVKLVIDFYFYYHIWIN